MPARLGFTAGLVAVMVREPLAATSTTTAPNTSAGASASTKSTRHAATRRAIYGF